MPASPSIHVSQFSDPSLKAAASLCGPAAAIAFARANGRSPSLAEAQELASLVGWTPEAGMAGPQSQQRLLEKMGIKADLTPGFDERRAAAEVAAGRPVTVSTGLHYFTASDFDPKTGRFFVSTSGTDVRGGSQWMSAAEMDKVSRDRTGTGINGSLYLAEPVQQDRQRFLEANQAPEPGKPAQPPDTASTEPDRIPVHRPLAEVGDTGTVTPMPTRKPQTQQDDGQQEARQQYLAGQMQLAQALLATPPRKQYPDLPPLPTPQPLAFPSLGFN